MASPQAVLPETRNQDSVPQSSQVTSSVGAAAARELKFSLGQVIVMWSIILGSMVAVFLFGLFTGREQGMKLALETQEQYAQRLPINRDVEGGERLAANRAQEIAVPAPIPNPETAPATIGQALSAVPAPAPVVTSPIVTAPIVTAPVGTAPVERAPVERAPAENAQAVASAPKTNLNKQTSKPDAVTTLASLANKLEPVEGASLGAAANAAASTAAVADNVPAKGGVVKTEPTKTDLAKSELAKPELAKPGPAKPEMAKSETVAKKESPSSPPAGGALAKGWYVQVAAAKSQSEVDGYSAKLKKIGLKAQLEIAVVRNVKYYRVMSGPFKTQAAAAGAQKKIKDARVSLSTPFTKQVS